MNVIRFRKSMFELLLIDLFKTWTRDLCHFGIAFKEMEDERFSFKTVFYN